NAFESYINLPQIAQPDHKTMKQEQAASFHTQNRHDAIEYACDEQSNFGMTDSFEDEDSCCNATDANECENCDRGAAEFDPAKLIAHIFGQQTSLQNKGQRAY